MKRLIQIASLAFAFAVCSFSLAADLPKELTGRWKTDDGRYSESHRVKILAQSGDDISGTLQTWSGRCKGAIAKFKGSFDGTVLTIATGPDSPCAPVTMRLTKEPDRPRYSGTWEVPDFKGTAFLE